MTTNEIPESEEQAKGWQSHAELVHHHAAMLRQPVAHGRGSLLAAQVWIAWALDDEDGRTYGQVAADAEAAKHED